MQKRKNERGKKELTSSLSSCQCGSVTSQFLHPTLLKPWQGQKATLAPQPQQKNQQPVLHFPFGLMNMHANNLCCIMPGLSTLSKHQGVPRDVTVKLTHQDERLNENTEKMPGGRFSLSSVVSNQSCQSSGLYTLATKAELSVCALVLIKLFLDENSS